MANKKNKIVKPKKTIITFDPAARKEYLTGFRKRKQERRKKAKLQLEQTLKQEKKKAREEAVKQASEARGVADRPIPEYEHLLPSTVSDFGSHEVEVTPIDLAAKKIAAQPSITDRNAVNKMTQKKLASSKVFKASQQIKSVKQGKKAKIKAKKTAKTKRSRHHHPNKIK